jgi:hypothetical protein
MREAERDAELEQALRRLERDTEGGLGAWADAERADVDAAAREVSQAERAQAVRAFEDLAHPRRRPTWGLGLAAAALIAGVALGFTARGLLGGDEPQQPVLLGPGRAVPLEPGPVVDRYDRFAWSNGGQEAQRYGLRVWNDGELEPVLSKDGLKEPAYAPSAAELASLGPAIHWEVVLQDGERRSLATLLSASASLRSR